MSPTHTNTDHPENVKIASGINLLAGLWFFVSPWVYNAWHMQSVSNNWIVGALIAIFAAIRIANAEGTPFLSRLNLLLGIWVFGSPWVFSYTDNHGMFINSLCVGVIVFILAIMSLRATPTMPAERPL